MEPKTIEELRTEYTSADEATKKKIRTVFVQQNLKLCMKLCHKSLRSLSNGPEVEHVELEDLEQAAVVGMLRAFETFEPGRAKFSTYGAYWIHRELQQALGQSQDIHKPPQTRKPRPVNEIQNKMRTLTGRDATAEEITSQRIHDLGPQATLAQMKKVTVTDRQLDFWRKSGHVESLDEIRADVAKGPGSQGIGNIVTLHDVTADATTPNPEQLMHRSEMAQMIADGMERLRGREAAVIHGLFYSGLTPAQLAKSLDVCVETIFRDRDKALGRLRRAVKR